MITNHCYKIPVISLDPYMTYQLYSYTEYVVNMSHTLSYVFHITGKIYNICMVCESSICVLYRLAPMGAWHSRCHHCFYLTTQCQSPLLYLQYYILCDTTDPGGNTLHYFIHFRL